MAKLGKSRKQRRSTAVELAIAFCVVFALGAFLGSLILAVRAQTPPAQPCLQADSPTCLESRARSFLAQGDAQIASGEIDAGRLQRAFDYWQQAVEVGIQTGAQASLTAQKRIQMYTLTCQFPADLTGIENDPLVSVRARQQSMYALGYYPGPLDGKMTPLTRSAIRRFQREMAWNETGDLKPRQIIYLMCNGAETARDPVTLTRLSLMYIAGAGVERNLGYARKFLTDASPRYSEATFLLALFYGTGHCQFSPHDPDRADQFLKEAAEQKHATAAEILKVYGPIASPAQRWEKIANGPAAKKALAILGDPCPRPQPEEPEQQAGAPRR